MKKKKSILTVVIALLMFALVGCGEKDASNTDSGKSVSEEKKSETTETGKKESENKKSEDDKKSGEDATPSKPEITKAGVVVHEAVYYADSDVLHNEKFFDNNGNLIKSYNADEKITYEYEYSADGKLIKESRAKEGGDSYVWQYDANGLIISELWTRANRGDVIESIYEYEYDGDGNPVAARYQEGTFHFDAWKREYADGRLVKQTDYAHSTAYVGQSYPSGVKEFATDGTSKYTTYDEKGNETGYFEYDARGNETVERNSEYELDYEYDDNNRLIKVFNTATGTTYVYEYDYEGSRTATIEYYSDGSSNSGSSRIYAYEYDEFGNLVKSVQSTKAGDVVETIVYEIHYEN